MRSDAIVCKLSRNPDDDDAKQTQFRRPEGFSFDLPPGRMFLAELAVRIVMICFNATELYECIPLHELMSSTDEKHNNQRLRQIATRGVVAFYFPTDKHIAD